MLKNSTFRLILQNYRRYSTEVRVRFAPSPTGINIQIEICINIYICIILFLYLICIKIQIKYILLYKVHSHLLFIVTYLLFDNIVFVHLL